jgi:hypothetical protein
VTRMRNRLRVISEPFVSALYARHHAYLTRRSPARTWNAIADTPSSATEEQMRRTRDVIVHSTCSSSIPSRPTNPSCGRRCLPTETHSIWPNGFWRISAAVAPPRSGSVRLCDKNAPFVTSGRRAAGCAKILKLAAVRHSLPLLDQFDLARPPILREERFERAVEAKEREPTLARHGL